MVTFRDNPVEPPRGFHLAATNRGTMVAPTSGKFWDGGEIGAVLYVGTESGPNLITAQPAAKLNSIHRPGASFTAAQYDLFAAYQTDTDLGAVDPTQGRASEADL
jgi:hypothetical protein